MAISYSFGGFSLAGWPRNPEKAGELRNTLEAHAIYPDGFVKHPVARAAPEFLSMKQFLILLTAVFPLSIACAQNEARKTDYGPFFSATILGPGGNSAMKGIVATVGEQRNAYVCFDADLMRASIGWTGDWLRTGNYLREIVHPQPPQVAGTPVFSTKPGPGWIRANGTDPRPTKQGPLPKQYGHYRGLYRFGDRTIFSYSVGNMSVLETPDYVELGEVKVFTRTFQVEGAENGWSLVAADAPGAPTAAGSVLALVEGDKCTAISVSGSNAELESANGKLMVKVRPDPGNKPVTFQVGIWSGAPADLQKFVLAADARRQQLDFAALTRGGPARWPEPVQKRGTPGTNATAYVIDTITEPVPNPWNTRTFFGGFDFYPDGRAAICTFHGDVWIVSGLEGNLENLSWKRHASGLFQPLGLKIVDGVLYVLGRDQITRLHDTNNDGEADFYENFNNDTVVTANYHEFCMDLQTDAAGNFYFFKGAPWSPEVKSPHQGTCLKVSKDGLKLEVFASGFRAPNGSAIGPRGELTVSDNQGHWMPSSKLNLVKPGGFYGMTPSAQREIELQFANGEVKANPSDPETRAKMRIKGWDAGAPAPAHYDEPICWLPQAMDNSSGGQVWAMSDKWGPLGNHLLFMSYGRGTLFGVMTEEVDGVMQAAMVRFPMKFPTGIMRGRVNPKDGQVYVCGLRGWQTDGTREGGFYRVRYTGRPAHLPTSFHVKSNGVAITFSEQLQSESAGDVANYSVEQWNYIYSGNYGSPEVSPDDARKKGHDKVEVKSAKLLEDGKTIFLEMPVKPVDQMKIRATLKAADGVSFNQEIYNTIHKVPAASGQR
jgi:hypothetical protein